MDHGPWDRFLRKYVVTHPSGINRARYASLAPKGRNVFEEYLRMLQGVEVARLTQPERKAFWINLYNALAGKIVLDHFPEKGIRDIAISPGIFSDGR